MGTGRAAPQGNTALADLALEQKVRRPCHAYLELGELGMWESLSSHPNLPMLDHEFTSGSKPS